MSALDAALAMPRYMVLPVPRSVSPGHTVIGTCSLCRGAVTVPAMWDGIVPPTPTCGSCGAIARPNHGPVIDMERT